MYVGYMVLRRTMHNALKEKHQNATATISQTEKFAGFVTYFMVISEWGFPINEMNVRYLLKYFLHKQGRHVPQLKKTFMEKSCSNHLSNEKKIAHKDFFKTLQNQEL